MLSQLLELQSINLTQSNAEEIAAKLQNLTGPDSDLNTGDINVVLNILNKFTNSSDYVPSSKEECKKMAGIFLEITESLLHERNSDSWEYVSRIQYQQLIIT